MKNINSLLFKVSNFCSPSLSEVFLTFSVHTGREARNSERGPPGARRQSCGPGIPLAGIRERAQHLPGLGHFHDARLQAHLACFCRDTQWGFYATRVEYAVQKCHRMSEVRSIQQNISPQQSAMRLAIES